MNMKTLVGTFIGILLVISLLPLLLNMSDEYNYLNEEESFTAIVAEATLEVVTVDNTPVEVTKVTVEGIELTLTTEYTVSGSDITVLANNSDIDEIIVVFYTYEATTTGAMDGLVQLLPTLIIIMLVVGVAYTIKMKK